MTGRLYLTSYKDGLPRKIKDFGYLDLIMSLYVFFILIYLRYES